MTKVTGPYPTQLTAVLIMSSVGVVFGSLAALAQTTTDGTSGLTVGVAAQNLRLWISSWTIADIVLWSLRFIAATGSGISAFYALYWAHQRRVRSDELFPRVNFIVAARFLGEQDGKVLTELTATLENKGVVPLKIKDFTFSVRGIDITGDLTRRAVKEQDEIDFPREIAKGYFMPTRFVYTFVYPGVTTQYNTVAAIPREISFIRIKSRFVYYDRPEEDHYAGTTLAVELKDSDNCAEAVTN